MTQSSAPPPKGSRDSGKT